MTLRDVDAEVSVPVTLFANETAHLDRPLETGDERHVRTLPRGLSRHVVRFVRVGEPCDTPGAYAFTERYEPVVCGGGRHDDRLVWRHMFR